MAANSVSLAKTRSLHRQRRGGDPWPLAMPWGQAAAHQAALLGVVGRQRRKGHGLEGQQLLGARQAGRRHLRQRRRLARQQPAAQAPWVRRPLCVGDTFVWNCRLLGGPLPEETTCQRHSAGCWVKIKGRRLQQPGAQEMLLAWICLPESARPKRAAPRTARRWPGALPAGWSGLQAPTPWVRGPPPELDSRVRSRRGAALSSLVPGAERHRSHASAAQVPHRGYV